MFRRAFIASLLVVGIALSVLAQSPTTKPAQLAVGEKARDFTVKRIDGKEIQLFALIKEGPVVMLMLRGWVGYQCPICNRQMGDFMTNAAKIKAAGAQVVLVYPGPAASVQDKANEFVAGKALPEGFHFVIDPDLKVVHQYALFWDAPRETAYPSTFVFDKSGMVRFVKISNSHGGRSSADEVVGVLQKLQTAPATP
jgi:peroxiredoxin